MKISGSFLSIVDNFKENVERLINSDIDYLHLDIMDGKFVLNKTWQVDDLLFLKGIQKPLDIHIMVDDIFKYIDDFKELNPRYITFHVEATKNILSAINYIKLNNIKAGIALNPETQIDEIYPYLEELDLILLMSVKPGQGAQSFIDVSDKVNDLVILRKENELDYKISVDGGINEDTLKIVKDADIVVVGSFITKHDNYENQIKKLKNN